MAAARPQLTVYNIQGKAENEQVLLPPVLLAPIRPDIVHFVHTSMNKNARQPYAVSEKAGHQHSAESWGTGRAVARIPRISGGGTSRSGQGAFGNMCRQGRMFAPTKTWRKWHRKLNTNQKRYAVASALAASALPALVLARGHKIEKVPEVPLVVSDAVEEFKKTKQAIALFKAIGAHDDVEKVQESRKLRAGVGKLRNRRHVQRRGPLVVYNEDKGLTLAFRNLPGVETIQVDRLNLLSLAPGGHLGRFVVWTQGAISRLGAIWGSVNRVSEEKAGYTLPRSIVTNSDITRIINSDEIQSKVRAATKRVQRAPIKKNPLTNLGALVKLNPYALTLRRAELLAQQRKDRAGAVDAARKLADSIHDERQLVNHARLTQDKFDYQAAFEYKKKSQKEAKVKKVKKTTEAKGGKKAKTAAKTDSKKAEPKKDAKAKKQDEKPEKETKEKKKAEVAEEEAPKKQKKEAAKETEKPKSEATKEKPKKAAEPKAAEPEAAPAPEDKPKGKKAPKTEKSEDAESAPAKKSGKGKKEAESAPAEEPKKPEAKKGKKPEAEAAAEEPKPEAKKAKKPEAEAAEPKKEGDAKKGKKQEAEGAKTSKKGKASQKGKRQVSDRPVEPVTDKYGTYEDDVALGKPAPVELLAGLNYLQGAAPAAGQPTLLVFWGQYHQPSYAFMPRYSEIAKEFPELAVVGISVDPNESYPKKYLDDPDKKYSKGEFPLTFAVAHDKGKQLQTIFENILGGVIPLPHSFLIDTKGKIIWRQDHSQIGATAPTRIDQVTKQIELFLAGQPLLSNGPNPFKKQASEAADDGEEADVAPADGDFSLF